MSELEYYKARLESCRIRLEQSFANANKSFYLKMIDYYTKKVKELEK